MERKSNTHCLSLSPKKAMCWLRTPKNIWKDLKKEFKFTIDLCASDKNHLVKRYYTKENNCLSKDWSNEIAYLHPMFDAGIWQFIKKAFKTKKLTIPHKNLIFRDFVLLPLCDIDKFQIHPIEKKSIKKLNKECVERYVYKKIIQSKGSFVIY